MSKLILLAGDHSPEALDAADHNYKFVRHDWCKCTDGDEIDRMAYYRSAKTGDHGWMCTKCHGILQTG